jgi:hypothetical protein
VNDIAASRLANHRLVGRQFKTPVAAVSWFAAVQAQEFAFAKWALSQRTGLTDAKIEKAFNRGEILRTHVLRPTWHFVAPADIRWMLALTGPRIRKAMTPYAAHLGIDEAQERKTRRIFARALAGKSLTRTDIKDELRRARIDASPQRCAHFLMYAELSGLITSGPRVGNQFTYALLEERAAPVPPIERDEALGELAKRYFQSRRPATIQDFVWWSGLFTADARRAIEISRVKIGETAKVVARGSAPSVHLLPIYDEYPLCYRDRSAAMSKHRANGRAGSIFVHLVVINGLVEGFWTRELGGSEAVIAVQPFRSLTRSEWMGIEREGDRHAAFLGMPVRISRRRGNV